MLLFEDHNLRIESDGRMVTAAESDAVSRVEALLKAAEAEAAAIRAGAEDEVAKARQEGYQQGLDDGQAEIIERKIKMVEQSVRYLEQLEGRVVDVVAAVLQKCIGELDCRQVIVGLIEQAMAAVVRTQRQMTIKVSPANLEVVQGRVGALHAKYPSVTMLNVVGDEHLSDTDCVLETDAGVVDASLKVQLDAIERAFRQCFEH